MRAFLYCLLKNQILTAKDFVALIQEGHYPGYAVKAIQGILTPVSNPDGRTINNLG